MVAMQRPDLVNRLVMISGGFDKSGEAAPDGAEHFPVVVAKIAEMAEKEPHLTSDDDLMTLTHAVDMFDALPDALVLDFLANEPVATVAPIRRAARPD
jgi:hypothetical protein